MTTTVRDYAMLAQFARARLIVAAVNGETVDYGELSPYVRLRWFRDNVLVPVAQECAERGEPDLTGLLV